MKTGIWMAEEKGTETIIESGIGKFKIAKPLANVTKQDVQQALAPDVIVEKWKEHGHAHDAHGNDLPLDGHSHEGHEGHIHDGHEQGGHGHGHGHDDSHGHAHEDGDCCGGHGEGHDAKSQGHGDHSDQGHSHSHGHGHGHKDGEGSAKIVGVGVVKLAG